ncbi:11003_t:CDS:2 [Funneliformis mosseae]|uniref:11003_t:CDS:1 n=1 Tax=Funneliformis mosseae TaxID=27381 RepID=A0A9N9BM72_FUNMO|nr:11003_t:CDS:2 [Funneliformis mosseae]
MARFPLLIKIANVLAYVFLTGANVYSGFGPEEDDSPYRTNHPTYISPASFVFGIGGLIHFLLGGYVIYQFFSSNQEVVEDGVGWKFVGISLLNTLWLYLWVCILQRHFHVIQLSRVYYLIKTDYAGGSFNEKVFIHAPFSLYNAWIYVMFIISIYAAFLPVKEEDESPSILVKSFVVLGLFILGFKASIVYIEAAQGDIVGAVVIAFTLYGIFVEQTDPVIHWTALGFAIITSIHILKPFYLKYVRGEEGERARLLP